MAKQIEPRAEFLGRRGLLSREVAKLGHGVRGVGAGDRPAWRGVCPHYGSQPETLARTLRSLLDEAEQAAPGSPPDRGRGPRELVSS